MAVTMHGATFTRSRIAKWAYAIAAWVLLTSCVSNEPYPDEWLGEKVLFTSFQEAPKYLDPVSSYSNLETPWVFQIYEAPYQYHYLKRPYRLEGRTASALPSIAYFDANGVRLPDDAPADRVATSVYTVPLKSGVRYQPHPALARDAQGQFLYHALTPDDLRGKYTLFDFDLDHAATSTREMTADDYVYQIKRLASPYVPTPSPIFGLMSQYIVGLKDLNARLRAERDAARAARPANDPWLPWRDLRDVPFEGARAVDAHTLEIRVIGKYPQFRFWLAMPFFSPVPWEADRFYAQRGMAEHDLTMNHWPIGTGPFMLAEQSASRYIMKKNPNYRFEPYPCEGMPGDKEAGLLDDCGQPMPRVDRVVSQLEKEREPRETKFMQGYYDTPQIERLDDGFALLKELQDNVGRAGLLRDHGVKLITVLEPNNWYMGFNMLDPVVGKGKTPDEDERHRKLRQAIAIATDWEEYSAVFFDEYGPSLTAMSAVPPGLFGYRDGEAGMNPYTHRWVDGRAQRRSIDEAKKLLAEAGYPGGRDAKTGLPLVLYYDANGVTPSYQARLDWQVKQMRKLDVQLEIRAADYNRFQDRMRRGLDQIYFWGWNADYPDPENFLFLLYGPQAKTKYDGENNSNYENPEYDRLYMKMRELPDGPERQAVIDQMVEISRREAVWMFGIFPGNTGVFQPWVTNVKPTIVINNKIQYMGVDPALRVAKLAQWNRARWWPMWVVVLALALAAWPAWRVWRRRELATAREALGAST